MENEEFAKVAPSKYFITLKGKKRQVKFGNYALARIEEKYGSLKNFSLLQKDMSETPMKTFPWLLSITLLDKEGLEDISGDELFKIMDSEDVSIRDVMNVLAQAMESSVSYLMGKDSKKKTPVKK